jgi:hypothetical protein
MLPACAISHTLSIIGVEEGSVRIGDCRSLFPSHLYDLCVSCYWNVGLILTAEIWRGTNCVDNQRYGVFYKGTRNVRKRCLHEQYPFNVYVPSIPALTSSLVPLTSSMRDRGLMAVAAYQQPLRRSILQFPYF